jgi:diacylglycerol O-acyltransferase / wax synthase
LSVPSQVKGIAHAHHGTVNDVLAAAVAGGLRALLASRGEPVDGLVLRAFVPGVPAPRATRPGKGKPGWGDDRAAAHRRGRPRSPTGPDRRRDRAAEKKNRPAAGTLFRTAVIQRAFLRYAGRQRFMNVYIANVPGPPVPLYLAGALLAEVFPAVPIMGNVPLGIGALSYAGQFNITVVADRDGCPDAEVFTAALRASLDNLIQAAPVLS